MSDPEAVVAEAKPLAKPAHTFALAACQMVAILGGTAAAMFALMQISQEERRGYNLGDAQAANTGGLGRSCASAATRVSPTQPTRGVWGSPPRS